MCIIKRVGIRRAERDSAPCRKVEDIDARQPAAAGERRFLNARYTARYCDARKTATPVESTIAKNGLIRDHNLLKIGRDVAGGVGRRGIVLPRLRTARVGRSAEDVAEE